MEDDRAAAIRQVCAHDISRSRALLITAVCVVGCGALLEVCCVDRNSEQGLLAGGHIARILLIFVTTAHVSSRHHISSVGKSL
jgi:hypothetical protein